MDREHAFWEYWRRVGAGEIPFERDLFESAIQRPYSNVHNVVQELAQRDRLPELLLEELPALLQDSGIAELDRALRFVRARQVVRSITTGRGEVSLVRAHLLHTGLWWAVLAVIDHLQRDEAQDVVTEIEELRVFTRYQRHQIRERLRTR
ncbi:MAG: hypothetical protein AAGD14_18715 [Planctomycetota bacterium]